MKGSPDTSSIQSVNWLISFGDLLTLILCVFLLLLSLGAYKVGQEPVSGRDPSGVNVSTDTINNGRRIAPSPRGTRFQEIYLTAEELSTQAPLKALTDLTRDVVKRNKSSLIKIEACSDKGWDQAVMNAMAVRAEVEKARAPIELGLRGKRCEGMQSERDKKAVVKVSLITHG